MKKQALLSVLSLLAVAAIFFSLPGTTAFAHGHTQVGDYELVIGFHNEPAYEGEPNGLDLFVTNTATGEPVNGLAETLKVEISFGASTRELEMRAQWGQDGAYTAYVLPTRAGDYTWHIWGMIEDTEVDVTMSSSPDTFSPVRAKDTVEFPESDPLPSALASTASSALYVGLAGVALGLAGVVLALRRK